jgi:crossover junction endodeoxyribonuclease RuvC
VPDYQVIMGVDAALAATGIGVVRVCGDDMEILHTELIKTFERQGLPNRLEKLHRSICEIIEKFEPDILALEDIFYSKNVKIALSLGQARGVVLLACAKYDLRLAEFKQAVTGNGAASKEQVAFMVKSLLKVREDFVTFDISDSLAAALCMGYKLNSMVV